MSKLGKWHGADGGIWQQFVRETAAERNRSDEMLQVQDCPEEKAEKDRVNGKQVCVEGKNDEERAKAVKQIPDLNCVEVISISSQDMASGNADQGGDRMKRLERQLNAVEDSNNCLRTAVLDLKDSIATVVEAVESLKWSIISALRNDTNVHETDTTEKGEGMAVGGSSSGAGSKSKNVEDIKVSQHQTSPMNLFCRRGSENSSAKRKLFTESTPRMCMVKAKRLAQLESEVSSTGSAIQRMLSMRKKREAWGARRCVSSEKRISAKKIFRRRIKKVKIMKF